MSGRASGDRAGSTARRRPRPMPRLRSAPAISGAGIGSARPRRCASFSSRSWRAPTQARPPDATRSRSAGSRRAAWMANSASSSVQPGSPMVRSAHASNAASRVSSVPSPRNASMTACTCSPLTRSITVWHSSSLVPKLE
ncbi:hypothetical protein ACFQHO_04715 [Actinomadura yumaensis]|uniref:hypothetical protein n=1 Tax=Actinomadura yumaensis TaxID=111807 RepID=UPI00361A199D